ncbi:hypothetical protein Tdes44962_MAKER02829, partial [Teratosphaeria destructans]
ESTLLLTLITVSLVGAPTTRSCAGVKPATYRLAMSFVTWTSSKGATAAQYQASFANDLIDDLGNNRGDATGSQPGTTLLTKAGGSLGEFAASIAVVLPALFAGLILTM